MPDEEEHIHVEQQSSAGKWILVFLAVVFVAGVVYAHVTTQQRVDTLTKGLNCKSACNLPRLRKRPWAKNSA